MKRFSRLELEQYRMLWELIATRLDPPRIEIGARRCEVRLQRTESGINRWF